MRKYSQRRVVLLIDFDNKEDRFQKMKREIPEELSDRVFILGLLSTPEAQSIRNRPHG